MDDLFDLSELSKTKKSKDQILVEQANVAYDDGLINEAFRLFNEALDENFDNFDAHMGLLRIHSSNFTNIEKVEAKKELVLIQKMFPYEQFTNITLMKYLDLFDKKDDEDKALREKEHQKEILENKIKERKFQEELQKEKEIFAAEMEKKNEQKRLEQERINARFNEAKRK